MKVIWDCVDNVVVANVVAKYYVKMVYPILLQVYLSMNIVKTIVEPTTVEVDNCLFRQFFLLMMPSLKNELQFLTFMYTTKKIANPLGWWATHLMQFSHVSFLAYQIFSIVES
jgi:hypothetical protein